MNNSSDKKYLLPSIILLLLDAALTVFAYFHLPQTIAIHFNSDDVANGFGDKAYVFLGLGIYCALFLLVSVIIYLLRNYKEQRLLRLLEFARVIIPLAGICD